MSKILANAAGFSVFAYQRVLRFARGSRWPLTMGVRTVLRDGGKVLLVRHTYTPGWHFPGGAVDPKETASAAALRELREETLIEASEAWLMGVYLNMSQQKSDHILVYEATSWRQLPGDLPRLEIAESAFFPIDDLPKGTTGGTRRRLAELAGEPPSITW